jgi:Tol biopolymer transport system component
MAIAALVVVGVAALVLHYKRATGPPAGASLAFAHATQVGTDIYVTDPRGGSRRLVGRGDNPMWSPDGSKVAFECGFDICVFDLATRRRVRLTHGAGYEATWSSSGDELAVRTANGLSVFTADGRSSRALRASGDTLVWSPRDNRIAFVDDDLYVIESDGTGLTKVARDAGVGTPAWSPDAAKLAFGDGGQLRVVDADGSNETSLVDEAFDIYFPTWSPDGKQLAVGGYIGERQGTFLLSLGGGVPRKLTDAIADGPAVWAPDGKALALSDVEDVWIVPVEGGLARKLTHHYPVGGRNTSPTWDPRGRSVDELPAIRVPTPVPSELEIRRNALKTRGPITALAADGETLAFFEAASRSDCAHAVFWRPGSSPVRLAAWPDCAGAGKIALSGGRLLWGEVEGGNQQSIELHAASLSQPNTESELQTSNAFDDGVFVGIVGSTRGVFGAEWSLRACKEKQTRPSPCVTRERVFQLAGKHLRTLRVGRDIGLPVAADANTIATLHSDGSVSLLGLDGILKTRVTGEALGLGPLGRDFPAAFSGFFLSARLVGLPKRNTPGLRIDGDDLVVLQTTEIDLVTARTGVIRRRWALARNRARALEDLSNGVVALATGSRLELMNLASGRRVSVRSAGRGVVHAQLERSGLVYSYSTGDRLWPGRVVFVPASELRRRYSAVVPR